MIETMTKNNKKELSKLEKKCQASSLDLIKYSEKRGMIAADIEPIIKTIAKKSGILKAA